MILNRPVAPCVERERVSSSPTTTSDDEPLASVSAIVTGRCATTARRSADDDEPPTRVGQDAVVTSQQLGQTDRVTRR